jgi:hypothetical protein
MGFIYLVIGIILGALKYNKALNQHEFKSNTTKIDALSCVFFWPLMLFKEVCFGNKTYKAQKKKGT